MKTDSAIKEFTEKYNREMIESIDSLSNRTGYKENKLTMPVVNLTEATHNFDVFMRGYADYKKKHIGDTSLSNEEIFENTNAFINKPDMFTEDKVLIVNLPGYIQSYLESVDTISKTADDIKSDMTESGVDMESIGAVNGFVDSFVERMQEQFYPVMDRILWASGYNARQRLSKAGTSTAAKQNPTPIFI